MNHSTTIPLGIWKSSYSYPSSGRGGTFEATHYVRLLQKGNHYLFESLPDVNKSYILMRLTFDDHVLTGNWQEQTEPDGYYKGAVYHGAIQMVVSDDGKRMKGKWVGFGKDMEVHVGPWEFNYLAQQLPAIRNT